MSTCADMKVVGTCGKMPEIEVDKLTVSSDLTAEELLSQDVVCFHQYRPGSFLAKIQVKDAWSGVWEHAYSKRIRQLIDRGRLIRRLLESLCEERMSLYLPLLITFILIPSLSNNPLRFGETVITPIEPVKVPLLAIMVLHADAM